MSKKEKEKLTLDKTHEALCREWHYEKNGSLKPSDVTAGSGLRVWWRLPYDDPRTGRHFIFEWQARIYNRVCGDGCPVLSNRMPWPGFNDLATLNQRLVNEWDVEKNLPLRPCDVTVNSTKKVYWRCEHGHSWEATVAKRYLRGQGCPICAKELHTSFPEQVVYYYLKRMFQDARWCDKEEVGLELDVYIPSIKVAVEYDGRRWHRDIDADKKKNMLCETRGIHLIRIREIGCPDMEENDFCKIISVVMGNNKSLSNAIEKIASWLGQCVDVDIARDLADIQVLIQYNNKKGSLAMLFPNLASQWHKTKNGNLTPDAISAKSGRTVWWHLHHEDDKTGQHDFEWPAAVADRTLRGDGCPYLTGHKIHPTFNSLLALNRDLANEWDIDRNRDLKNGKGEDISTPDKVGPGSHQKVWWQCSVCGHEWIDSIEKRNLGRGCPECKKRSRKPKTISQSELTFNSNEQSA